MNMLERRSTSVIDRVRGRSETASLGEMNVDTIGIMIGNGTDHVIESTIEIENARGSELASWTLPPNVIMKGTTSGEVRIVATTSGRRTAHVKAARRCPSLVYHKLPREVLPAPPRLLA